MSPLLPDFPLVWRCQRNTGNVDTGSLLSILDDLWTVGGAILSECFSQEILTLLMAWFSALPFQNFGNLQLVPGLVSGLSPRRPTREQSG